MQLIAFEEIIIPSNRQRKGFDQGALDELARSIAEKGLLHPIVCTQVNDKVELIAGERRLRALEQLSDSGQLFHCDGHLIPPGQVPYTLVSELDEVQLKEAELEENIMREDLTWQEKTAAIAELHELRIGQDPTHTFKDTAEEIKTRTGRDDAISRQAVSRAVTIAKHLDDPEVREARNEKEARNIVLRKAARIFEKELANRHKSIELPHTLIQGDLREELPKLPEAEFDMLITDPPYGMGAQNFGDAAIKTHGYDDTREYADSIIQFIIEQSTRVCKPDSFFIMFCDIDSFHFIRAKAELAGWKMFRTPLIWDKGSAGHMPWGPLFWRRCYEVIAFGYRGDAKLKQLGMDLIKNYPPERDKPHAAAKPWGVYMHFMTLGLLAGAKVLDPCCGSGPVFTAAYKAKCVATGIELDAASVEMSQDVLNEIRHLSDE